MQNNCSSTVAVVGLGKIGLPLAVQYARQGKRVIGCDINPSVVEKICAGQSHIHEEPGLTAEVSTLVQKGLLTATVDTIEAVRQAGVVVVIVPVVIDEMHEVDFRGIDAATIAIGGGLQRGSLVIYETTLPVGTTAKRFGPLLARYSILTPGQDFHLAYSPERVSSGRIFHDLRNYPKVVGGIDDESRDAAVAFYRSVLHAEIISMASTDDAEFVKLIETTYRDVNIALANEYACFADVHGLDVESAIAAANTQPYSHIHAAGVGVGGHCIPVYPYFLLNGLKMLGQFQGAERQEAQLPMLTLPRAARRINDAMAEYAVNRIEAITGPLGHQSVLMLGVAYRGNVRETAFTSARLLQDALIAHGAIVYVEDPLFNATELQALGYTLLPEGYESEIRAVLLQADHAAYQSLDFTSFPHCQVVMDGRRALRNEQRAHIESLGMRYIAVGDGGQEKIAQQHRKKRVVASGVYDERGHKKCE
jgi:nucleotide sugar dehydrogenase